MPKIRVAIAGLGRAAKVIHVPALKKLPNVEIVGGFDPASPRLDFPVFGSLEELLAAKPDVVVIATPPDGHPEIAKAALAAGAHVFCEKPLANSIEEADSIASAAAAAGKTVCVNSEFPFMPTHLAAAREIGSERFGRLLFVEAHQSFVVTQETEAGWRGEDPQRTFKEFGTHVIDLCKAFFGEQPSVMRSRMPRPFASGGPDYLNLVQLEFSGDRVAQITLDRLTKGRHNYLDVRLVGEKGTIETSIGGSAEMTLGLRPQGRRPFADLNLHMGGVAKLYHGDRSTTLARAPLDLFADATATLFRAFLDAIAQGREPPSGIAEARDTLSLIYRAYAEAGAGQP
ncbi:MAG: Gfo/Idh/MocA family oxidoreductase [Sphingomonas sp.]|nr:Gfo/Idh/MocA family oxidoreductase [Sphingomonas sp.]